MYGLIVAVPVSEDERTECIVATNRELLPDSVTHSWYSSGKVSVKDRSDSASGLVSPA